MVDAHDVKQAQHALHSLPPPAPSFALMDVPSVEDRPPFWPPSRSSRVGRQSRLRACPDRRVGTGGGEPKHQRNRGKRRWAGRRSASRYGPQPFVSGAAMRSNSCCLVTCASPVHDRLRAPRARSLNGAATQSTAARPDPLDGRIQLPVLQPVRIVFHRCGFIVHHQVGHAAKAG